MQSEATQLIRSGKTIGLVPTMGFLHEGHLSLIRRARKHCDVTVVSIFVNPTQFGPKEDYLAYPRNEKADLEKVKAAGGDIVFLPAARQLYPLEFETTVEVTRLTQTLEGSARPGHFRGVTTIVAKLFNIVRPDVAVFGQKDLQQARVLQQMTRDLNYSTKFIIAPTVRESSGLAMSSRNAYLKGTDLHKASCLYMALHQARTLVNKGSRKVNGIERQMRRVIKDVCPTSKIEYISFTDFRNLRPTTYVKRGTYCSLAVRVHGVRLIDNIRLL